MAVRGAVWPWLVAAVYLVVCAAAFAVALWPVEDANLGGVWVLLVTAPLGPLAVALPLPDSWGVGLLVVAAVVQALVLWLVLRVVAVGRARRLFGFDEAVGAGDDDRLVAVFVADAVGRFAVGAEYFDDFGGVLFHAYDAALEAESVAYFDVHVSSSWWFFFDGRRLTRR